MTGYERNHDFADLIHCASMLNKLASMNYGEEKVVMGRSHAKQRTIWGKLYPLDAGVNQPDLADFNGVRTDDDFIATLKKVRYRASDVAPDPMDNEGEGFEGELSNPNAVGDLWDLAIIVQPERSDSEQEDGAEDLTVVGHERSMLCPKFSNRFPKKRRSKHEVEEEDNKYSLKGCMDREGQKIRRKYNDANDRMRIYEFMRSL
ncbi:hypothetical protein R1sor_020216 [Riccia sorocarpa]|uniref:Uncharacterized protein n=1 Tax=Riccia sorocarpa TaxID=122646 RepID=A0ABD3II25_9MARC